MTWDTVRKAPKMQCYNKTCGGYDTSSYGCCSYFPFPYHLDNCDGVITLDEVNEDTKNVKTDSSKHS